MLSLQKTLELFKKAYYSHLNTVEIRSRLEYKMLITLQKNFRMLLARNRFREARRAAIQLQKSMRAYLHRKVYLNLKFEDFKSKNKVFYSSAAVVIQKFFKGFYVRKYTHDYYSRKKFMRHILEQNERVLEQLRLHEQETIKDCKERNEQEYRASCQQLADRLHHLLSTKSIPGVYSTGRLKEKKVGELVIEDYIKKRFRIKRGRVPKDSF